ncbi:hypothetical protein N752_17250 [Desulforamulus aquiferis]|nr:DUF4258 domain-containing protein [Desulforamulus aquiferis]RYD03834.1 hypothetical protein N752_17250 [Desulforamulus aquiferis]
MNKQQSTKAVLELIDSLVEVGLKEKIYFRKHALEEMDEDNLTRYEITSALKTNRLIISSHWEEPHSAFKLIYLLEIPNKPKTHVVCLLVDNQIIIFTVYAVDSRFNEEGKIRVR